MRAVDRVLGFWGRAALIYEVVWTRMASQVSAGTAHCGDVVMRHLGNAVAADRYLEKYRARLPR